MTSFKAYSHHGTDDGTLYFNLTDLSSPMEVVRCPLSGGKAERVTHFTKWFDDEVAVGKAGSIARVAAGPRRAYRFIFPGPSWPAGRSR